MADWARRGILLRFLLEVEQLSNWPAEVARSDLAAFFTLSLEDLRWVRAFRSPRTAPDRLGLAVQLCARPFLGYIPAELASTPAEVVTRLAERVGSPPVSWRVTSSLSATDHVASTPRQ